MEAGCKINRLDPDQCFEPPLFVASSMVKPGIARDLYLLTATKLLVLGIIYVALFAPFANRPDDTSSHLLGTLAAGATTHQTAPGGL
jgi:hypothetical protein